jgi:hypothetical protein
MANSNQLSILKTKKRSNRFGSSQEQEMNLVALCSLATLGISMIGLLVSMMALNTANKIADKPMPTLVQTTSGKTMQIKTLEGKDRSNEAIKDFTVKTFTNLFTWRVFLIPTNQEEMRTPKADPGVAVDVEGKANLKLPTPVWGASFTIADDFRQEFLGKYIAPLITNLKILQGSSEVAFIPITIQDPIELPSKKPNVKLWKVKMVANLAVRTAANLPETLVPFNRDVYVESVTPPLVPDLNHLDQKADLQAVIGIARSSGLQIIGMDKFTPQDLINPDLSK